MDAADKRTLEENTLYLQEHIITTPTFKTRLKTVLPKESIDDIFKKKPLAKQIERLVWMLCRRGASAMSGFLNILRDTDQAFIAQHLLNESERIRTERETARWVASCTQEVDTSKQLIKESATGSTQEEQFCTQREMRHSLRLMRAEFMDFRHEFSDKLELVQRNLHLKANELEVCKKEIKDLKRENVTVKNQLEEERRQNAAQRQDLLARNTRLSLQLKQKENEYRKLEEEVLLLRKQLERRTKK